MLRYNPALQRARELGIPVTSQMRLFMQLCPGKTVGITGSSGKSTTTALVGGMAREVTALDAQRVDEDALSADFRGRRE